MWAKVTDMLRPFMEWDFIVHVGKAHCGQVRKRAAVLH